MNIRIHFTIALLLFNGLMGKAQNNPRIDSLQRELALFEKKKMASAVANKQDLDTTRVLLWYELYKCYSTVDAVKADSLAKLCLDVSASLQYKRGLGIGNSCMGIAIGRHDPDKALPYHEKALGFQTEAGDRQGMAISYLHIGKICLDQKQYAKALSTMQQALTMGQELKDLDQIKYSYLYLADIYTGLGRYKEAYENRKQYKVYYDSVFNSENRDIAIKQEMKHDFEKKEMLAKAEQDKKDALARQEFKRQRILRNGFIVSFVVVLLFAVVFFRQRNRIKEEKQRSDDLLLNILPSEIAEELKDHGTTKARNIDLATILFTDFTEVPSTLSGEELVNEINACFEAFDHIIGTYQIEKIKTIGDAYMAAGGLPIPTDDSVKKTVLAALDMQSFIISRKKTLEAEGKPAFDMRIGIHTGPVVAGIVGVKKFQYDLWGDTVNTANRVESNGQVGKVNISHETYQIIKDDPSFKFESRGLIAVKGKGEMEMWFVEKAGMN